jgi:hypothetical protein
MIDVFQMMLRKMEAIGFLWIISKRLEVQAFNPALGLSVAEGLIRHETKEQDLPIVRGVL